MLPGRTLSTPCVPDFPFCWRLYYGVWASSTFLKMVSRVPALPLYLVLFVLEGYEWDAALKGKFRAVPRHPRKETRMVLGRRVSEDLWLWYIRYAVWDWVRGPVYAGLLGRHEVSSLYSSPVSLPGQELCAAHARCAVESGAWSGVLLCRLMFSLVCVQGEDGFPGFKGDMGIKGDRVSVMGLGFGPVTSRVGLGDLHESHRCWGSQRSLSEGRQHLCKTWSEQQVSGA